MYKGSTFSVSTLGGWAAHAICLWGSYLGNYTAGLRGCAANVNPDEARDMAYSKSWIKNSSQLKDQIGMMQLFERINDTIISGNFPFWWQRFFLWNDFRVTTHSIGSAIERQPEGAIRGHFHVCERRCHLDCHWRNDIWTFWTKGFLVFFACQGRYTLEDMKSWSDGGVWHLTNQDDPEIYRTLQRMAVFGQDIKRALPCTLGKTAYGSSHPKPI